MTRCAFCDLTPVPNHVHLSGPPVAPCRACLDNEHDDCDPLGYFCACSCGLTDERDTP